MTNIIINIPGKQGPTGEANPDTIAARDAALAAQEATETIYNSAVAVTGALVRGSKSVIAALDTATVTTAWRTDNGQTGMYSWDGSDLSSKMVVKSVTSTSVASHAFTKTDHRLRTGQAVFSKTAANGLSANTVYFVIFLTVDTFRLATTFANAHNGTAGTNISLVGSTNMTFYQLSDYLQVMYITKSGTDLDGSSGAWVRQVLDHSAVTPELFGAVGDGTTSDFAALSAMGDWGRARGSLHVTMRSGAIYTHQNPYFLCGIKTLTIDGNNASIKNTLGDGSAPAWQFVNLTGLVLNGDPFISNFMERYRGSPHPTFLGQKFDTVLAGVSTLTLSGGATPDVDIQVGRRVLIYGFDRQGTASYPPNARYFEWKTVTAVSGSNISFSSPLAHYYDQEWIETDAPNSYGAPRIISLERPGVFVECEDLIIRDLNIKLHSGWTHASGTADRNGRLTLGGCKSVVTYGGTVDGGIYTTQCESLEMNKCGAVGYVETDKLLGRVDYNDMKMGTHAQGGSRVLKFKNCDVGVTFSAGAIHDVILEGGRFRGVGAGSATALLGVDSGAERFQVIGTQFSVEAVARVNVFSRFLAYSAAWTVVDTNTISIARTTLFSTSRFMRSMRVGSRLYTVDNKLAAVVTRNLYDTSGTGAGATVYADVSFVRPITTGTTLYLMAVDRVDLDGVNLVGPYAEGVDEFERYAATTPEQTRIYSTDRSDNNLIIRSKNYTPGLPATQYFTGTGAFVPQRIVINVLKAYTGVSGAAAMIFKEYLGGTNVATINLLTTGRRVIDHASTAGAVAGDTLGTLPTGAVRSWQIQSSGAAPTITDSHDNAIWNIEIFGSRVEF